jgi:hypothetical protein
LRKTWVLLSAVVMSFAFCSHALAQCESLTKWGIWEVRDNSVDETVAMSYINWLYQMQFESAASAHSATTSLSGMFEGVWADLNLKSDDRSWSEFRKELESLEKRQHYARKISSSHIKTASQQVLNTVRACLEREGVHAWIQTTNDVKKFYLRITYHPIGTPPLPVVDNFDVPDGVSCTPKLSKRRQIKPGTLNVLCTRSDVGQPVTVNLNTDPSIVGDYDLSLPAIKPVVIVPPPSPLPSKTRHTRLYKTLYTTKKVKLDSGMVIGEFDLPPCPASQVTTNPSYKWGEVTCQTQYIGDSVVESDSGSLIFVATVPATGVTTGAVHNNAPATPIGYLLAQPRSAADVPLYRGNILNCNAGMVVTADGYGGCSTTLIGYVMAPD